MSSAQAAARLGVSVTTLYSYVSRGLLHPLPASEVARENDPHGVATAQDLHGVKGSSRAKFYRRNEVERLARRNAAAHEPRRATKAALDFGLPVLESALCLIEGGRFFYRGIDVLELAEHATLEETAALLWSCDSQALRQQAMPRWPTLAADERPMPQRMRARFNQIVSQGEWTAALADDRAAHWSLVQAMLLAGTGCVPAPPGAPLHVQIDAAWGLPTNRADDVRRALVLTADHELNASSFTARCVASTGADAAAAMSAALAALGGPRHGAMSLDLEALWPQVEAASRSATRVEQWLDGQKRVPGFGHALYPEGDPRARALLMRLPAQLTHARLVQAIHRRAGREPNLDFGLVALTRALGAPPGAAFALFAIARSVGWLAHVFEQQALGTLIRPRAAYIGPRVQPPGLQPPNGRVIRAGAKAIHRRLPTEM